LPKPGQRFERGNTGVGERYAIHTTVTLIRERENHGHVNP